MVQADDLFDGTSTSGVEFNDPVKHFWKCPRCGNTTFSGQVEVCDVDGYERKEVIRCGDCQYKDMVHYWYRAEKRMTDLVSADVDDPKRYNLVLDYYWTGHNIVKAVIEEGPMVTGYFREPREHHPQFVEAQRTLPLLTPTLEKTGMEDHDEHSTLAITHDDMERAGVSEQDVET